MSDDSFNLDDDAKALLQRAYTLKDKSQSQALYASWAKTYDKTMLQGLGYLTPHITANLLVKYVFEKSARILDIGAGTGLAGLALKELGFENIDALDYSPQMLSVAAHRDVYKNLIEADLNKCLDLADNCYDALICTGTFTHAHVGASCLDELFRIIKPEGMFACTVHKDIWQSEGFEGKIASLQMAEKLSVVFHELGKYYSGSNEPEGWYIVWQKQA